MTTDTLTHPADTRSISQGHWRLDPTRSRVEFRTPTAWGLLTVKGHFERYEGTLDLQQNPAIGLKIEAASLNTNLGFRDRHLRSADFFDVVNHPQVSFVSDSATLEGERLHVRGRLHAAGKSIPLELAARLRRVGDELEVDTTTNADHRKLGMSHGLLGMIPTPTKLIVNGRLVRGTDRAGE
jgi:polyisoprenoid-binding protein YceI